MTEEEFRREMAKTGAWTKSELEEWVLGRLMVWRGAEHRGLAQVSSSAIRAAIKEKGVESVRAWVTPGVRRYIVEQGLYAVPPT